MRRVVLPLGVLLPAVASATVLADWSLADLVARADLIVIARAEAPRYLRAGEQLMTETPLAIEEVLAGEAPATVVLSQLGGKDGDREVEIVGDARLVAGRRYVLFTRAHPDGRRYLVGMALGAFEIEATELRQRIDAPLLGPAGEVRPAPGRRAFDLEQVRRVIAEARR